MSKPNPIAEPGPVLLQRVPVEAGKLGERLDNYAATLFPEFPTKSSARKAIERGEIWLNGAESVPYHRMAQGDVVEHAKRMLSREHGSTLLERAWGPGDGRPVQDLKVSSVSGKYYFFNSLWCVGGCGSPSQRVYSCW